MKKRIEYIIKNSKILQKIYKIIGSMFFRFIGFFVKTNDKLILFTGQAGKINDSPLEIYNQIRDNKKFEDYQLIWAVNSKFIKHYNDYTVIKIDSIKYFIFSLKAKYWIASVNIERGLNYKKKKTIYLNTWHGIPLKTIGNSAGNRKDYDFSNIDFFCVSSDYEIDIYIKDFKIKPQSILKSGMPRNDSLSLQMEKGEKELIKNELGINNKEKKVILYAPTWRESNTGGKNYDIKPPLDFVQWEKHLGNDYILLVRMHPYTTKLLNVNYNSFVRDVSNYPSINNLIQISDLLITDYSAIFFDFAITEKPVLLFTYDYLEYKKKRGLYLNMEEEFKNILMFDQDDLLQNIEIKNYDLEIVRKVKRKFHKYSGSSTKMCIDTLFRNL